jgi:DNA modification methylase
VEPVSKPGDLWILGNHRLLCGDSTLLSDVERLMDGQLADMAFTDPPYNVDYGNNAKDKMRGKDRRIMNDALGDGFYQFLYDACLNLLVVTKGACYVCMSSSELHTLQKAWIDAGGKWSTFIIWAKNTFTLGRADYQRQYEPILYGWKQGTDHFWCGDRDQSDIWNYNKPRVNDLHPTMKPVELVERAIQNSSKSRDIVLDLFGGSGTTLIACEKTNRQARLVELDPKFVDVIVKRWEEYTGKKAVLSNRDIEAQAEVLGE